jgi:hypothetical protein
VENGHEELILLTDNQLKVYDDYDSPATEKFTWLDKVSFTGNVVESKRLDGYISPENIPCSWGVKSDSSIYKLSSESVLYRDEKLITSFESLKTASFNCSSISIAGDKSILVNGRYYFSWQKQSWQNVKPLEIQEYDYHIKSFNNPSSLGGLGVELVTDSENLKVLNFRVIQQEYDIANSKLTTTRTPEINPEMDLDNVKDFFKIAEDSEKIYVITHDLSYSFAGFYTIDKPTGTIEIKAENINLPKNAIGDQGLLFVTNTGNVYYVLSDCGLAICKERDTKIYYLDSDQKFINITPKKVEEKSGISSVFVFGKHLYVALVHSFTVSSGDWVIG